MLTRKISIFMLQNCTMRCYAVISCAIFLFKFAQKFCQDFGTFHIGGVLRQFPEFLKNNSIKEMNCRVL